jgi:hypothetical protein
VFWKILFKLETSRGKILMEMSMAYENMCAMMV